MMADATYAMVAIFGMPPTIGFINSGGVLKDGILGTQTGSSFRAVLAPKLASAGAAFTVVDHPVHHVQLFSSSASLFGNPGQSNYAAANATLEGWASFSRSCGVNAIAIQWGPWEVGKCCFGFQDITKSGKQLPTCQNACRLLHRYGCYGCCRSACEAQWNGHDSTSSRTLCAEHNNSM